MSGKRGTGSRSQNTAKARTLPKTAWKKGQSGNPGGRPKLLQEVRDAAQKRCLDVVEILWDIARDEDRPEQARIAAGTKILEYGVGKPPQRVELEGNPDRPIEFRGDALDTDEMRQLRELVAKGAAAAAAAAGDDDPDGEA